MLWTFSLSVQGESHKKKESENSGRLFPCQDNSDDDIYKKNPTYPAAVISVADGHGSPAYFRSRIGSKKAVKIGTNALKKVSERVLNNYQNDKNVVKTEYLSNCLQNFSSFWKNHIELELRSHPITEEEKDFLKQEDIHALQKYLTALEEKSIEDLLPIYGTTLCSAMLISKIGFFAMQLGDGNIAVKYKDEPFVTAVEEDKNCFLNQTTSLCDKNSQDEIRFFATQRIPEAVFCCTDGFENSFKDEKQLMEVYEKVYDLFKSYEGDENKKRILALEELKDWLPKLSKKGSGDDISLAGIILE